MNNTIILNFYDFSEKRLMEYAHYLDRYNPRIIRGYAGAIYLFVEYCYKKNIKFVHKPKAIILTSEKIYQNQKEQIGRFFESEVFEEYGAREFSLMAHECEAHQGLHLAEELFLFEIIDRFSKRTVFEGKGEILVTPFFNYAMPLLRYRIGDEGEISSSTCSCGRTLKRLLNIEGRITDYIVTASERFIRGGLFNVLISRCDGVSTYQVRQHEKGVARIYVIKGRHFKEEEMNKLKREIENMYKDDLTISFEYVDKIIPSPSGKRRPIISDIAARYHPVYYAER